MFIDASAICAVVLSEKDGDRFFDRMLLADVAITSPMAVWESAVSTAKGDGSATPSLALAEVMRLLEVAGVRLVAVPPEAATLAVEAFERYGKGRHPAALNFGDCFAYACARHFGVPLLYKGDDFSRTDIETVAIGD